MRLNYFPHPQIQAVEWPFEDSNGNGSTKSPNVHQASTESIANYLSQKKVCLVINLPLRQHRTAPDITKGYLTRRMAIEFSVPLVTDIKCAKLLVKVSGITSLLCLVFFMMYNFPLGSGSSWYRSSPHEDLY